MRPPRRKSTGQRRRLSPRRSPFTVPRAVAALRSGREALNDIQGQLEAILVSLRDPDRRLDPGAPERLAGATRQAGHALSQLDDVRRLFAHRP